MNAIERAKYLIKAANEADDRADYAATVAEAHAMAVIAQAEATERVATHLGNIHQALLTPNADSEPVTAADQLSRIADALEFTNTISMNPYR